MLAPLLLALAAVTPSVASSQAANSPAAPGDASDDAPTEVTGARALYRLRLDAPAELIQLREQVRALLERTGAFSCEPGAADGAVVLAPGGDGVSLLVRRPGVTERTAHATGEPRLLAGPLADSVLRAFGLRPEFNSLIAFVRGGSTLSLASPGGEEQSRWPSSGDVVSVGWSDGGQELVYARASDARRELLRARLGRDETPLPWLSWPGFASSPTLLPGGIYYFAGATAAGTGIFWGTLGAPPQLLFARRSGALEVSPAIDGTHHRLAFITDRTGQQRVHLAALDGSGERALETGLGQALDPAFSPDGDQLAYALAAPGGAQQLWVLDLVTGQRRAVTSGPGLKTHPSWSPGGGLLAYQLRGDGPAQLWTAAAAGGSERLLVSAPGGATLPAWGPLRNRQAVASR